MKQHYYAIALRPNDTEHLGTIDGATGHTTYLTGDYSSIATFTRYCLSRYGKFARWNIYLRDGSGAWKSQGTVNLGGGS